MKIILDKKDIEKLIKSYVDYPIKEYSIEDVEVLENENGHIVAEVNLERDGEF